MKLQVLELPTEHVDKVSRTPFVIVFSEVKDEDHVRKILAEWNRSYEKRGKHPWGSSGSYVTTAKVEL